MLLEINQTFSSLQFMRRKKSQLKTPTLAELKKKKGKKETHPRLKKINVKPAERGKRRLGMEG